VAIECRYRHTSTFKDIIDIEVDVAEITALKISFKYTMRVGSNTVCTATSTHCFLEQGRPVSLEKRFPELYKRIITIPNSEKR
jgi:acyl-CoA thioester hydrolase